MLLETLAAVGTLGALGAGGAGLRYLWRVASGEDSQRQHIERLQQIAATRDIGIAMAQASAPPALPEHYTHNPTLHLHLTGGSTRAAEFPNTVRDAGEAPAPGIPGPIDLADLNFVPSPQRLLLALGDDGQPLTVSAKQVMHVALAGATGSGKTSTARLLLAQILAVGGRVVIANPHWTRYDAESGDDWTAIERRLHLAPAIQPDDIDDLLRWLTQDELEQRKARKQAGELPGEGLTLYVDELPVIVDEVPDAAKRLGKLLREGRSHRIYVCGASQDFLTRTIGSSSSIREAYRTAFYSGGDLVSARSLLDMRQNEIEEHRLGQGVVYLRSSATTPARLVRVPLASNEGIARLLGDDSPTMPRVVSTAPPAERTDSTTATSSDTVRSGLSAQAERVRQAMAEGLSQTDTIRRVWGCEPNTREGRKATDEYRAILADLAKAVGGIAWNS